MCATFWDSLVSIPFMWGLNGQHSMTDGNWKKKWEYNVMQYNSDFLDVRNSCDTSEVEGLQYVLTVFKFGQ